MEDDTLKVDGFDDAIMGFAGRCGLNDVLLYSMKKIIKILKKRDGMSEDELKKGAQMVQDLTNTYTTKVEDVLAAKEADIMTI